MREIIDRIGAEIQARFKNESSGHDWWHIHQVWQMAILIGKAEGGDMHVIELAALLHDVADWKFYDGNDTMGPRVARSMMDHYGIPADVIDHVCEIIATLSFKGAGVPTPMRTLEGKIVQDADRLEALGAIGIARCFAYGGHAGRAIYDPDQPVTMHQTKEAYITAKGSGINHFFEKLLLIKDRMNTATAKKIAEHRHEFMEQFLEEFFQEWNRLA